MIIMKSYILGIMMILGVSVGYAQSSIKWLSDEFNFGAFKEDSGLVTCQFKGVNVSDEHVAIIRARATCGCTTPQYSSSAFAPGDTITVTVSYDPEGRPGRFMKKVYIKNSNDDEQSELRIRGVVIAGEETLKGRYPIDCGKLRLQNDMVAMGELLRGKAKAVFLSVYNHTTDTIVPHLENIPSYIKSAITPSIVPPGEQSSISIHYDAFYCEKWGVVNDSITLITDSQDARKVTIDITANIVPNFSKMTPGERINAPLISIATSSIDFGRIVRDGGVITKEFIVKNEGENPLLIHRVYSLDDGVEVNISKTKLKKGKSAKVNVKVDPAKCKEEILNATVRFVANDPTNYQPSVRLVGEIR